MASHRIFVFAGLYFLLFSALGAEVPFLPYFFSTTGLSAPKIGIVLTIGTVAQMPVAPLVGLVADRLGIRLILGISAVSAAFCFSLLLAASGGLWKSVLIYVLFAMATAPLNPLADAVSVPVCLGAGVPYGWVRGWGSAGFLCGLLATSTLTSHYGVWSIVPTTVALFAFVVVMIPALPRAVPAEVMSKKKGTSGGLGSLLVNPSIRRVLLVGTLLIGSHAMSDAFAVIHWRANGIGAKTIGILLAAAVGSELVVFFTVGPRLLCRLGPSACATLGAAFGAFRWGVLAESDRVWLLLATQLLHGFTFSLVHLACMHVLAIVAPRRLFATAQSLYGTCSSNIASAVVTLTSGALFGTFHAHAFWLASCLCLVAAPITLRLERQDGSSFG